MFKTKQTKADFSHCALRVSYSFNICVKLLGSSGTTGRRRKGRTSFNLLIPPTNLLDVGSENEEVICPPKPIVVLSFLREDGGLTHHLATLDLNHLKYAKSFRERWQL